MASTGESPRRRGRDLAVAALGHARLLGAARRLRMEPSVLRFARETAALGAGPLGRAHLFLHARRSHNRWTLRRPARLRLRALGRSFDCRIADYSQLHVLREVFLTEDYRVDDLPPPATILDLGSNMGASLIYFRLRYPAARIIGVEADPFVFPTLERNVAPFGGIELAQVGVAGSSGEAVFFHNEHSWASSLKPLWPMAQQVTVRTRSLEDLLDDFGLRRVDLVKIDVEGAEWDVLRSVRRFDRIGAIIGEIHAIEGEHPRRLLEHLGDFRVSVTDEMGDAMLRFVARRD